MNIREKICKLKQEKDVLILAHYYADKEVQELADFAGDSYALARKAAETTQKNILFAGVSFMGESAKLLNPDRHVYMLDPTAGCPMADMVTAEQVKEARARYPKAAVVCYVNSSAEVKAESDVCVTSSNAVGVESSWNKSRSFLYRISIWLILQQNCFRKKNLFIIPVIVPRISRLTKNLYRR